MRSHFGLIGVLAALGAAWGLSQPLTKIAVTSGHGSIGLVFWQFLTGAVVLAAIQLIRRRPVPLGRPEMGTYTVIALIGTLLPMSASYIAYGHVASGIMSILISTVPMLAFPMALVLGSDRFSWRRLAGLSLGLLAMLLILLPQERISGTTSAAWILLGMVAPAFYAMEASYVGHWGTRGMGAMQVLHGASWVGAALSAPLALASGQMFLPGWNAADLSLIAASVLHAFAYSGYVWLVGRAGSTFAAQCSYLVTGFGVIWAMLLLGERYSGLVWLALLLVLAGLTLVQPRVKPGLAAAVPPGENDAA